MFAVIYDKKEATDSMKWQFCDELMTHPQKAARRQT